MQIHVETTIEETPRTLQVRGLFDIPAEKSSAVEWDVEDFLPPWPLGLITDPSGCGKSTLAHRLFPAHAP